MRKLLASLGWWLVYRFDDDYPLLDDMGDTDFSLHDLVYHLDPSDTPFLKALKRDQGRGN